MKSSLRLFKYLLIPFLLCIVFSFKKGSPAHHHVRFPYKKAGLTERQAAAHLLNRFTFGPTPGQVDAVIKTGLEDWFASQLEGSLADDSVNAKLSSYDALNLTNAEVLAKFPKNYIVLRMAQADSFISKDSVSKGDPKIYKQQLEDYMKLKGFRPEQELFRQFISQKIIRAAYSNNQLKEVLTDFWFNHFNVSFTKNECAQFIPSYERDVIRPNALGKFSDLLLGTAKSPAMLVYLDNFTSTGENTNTALPGNEQLKRLFAERQRMQKDTSQKEAQLVKKLEDAHKTQGLNENYAREVMELHTLGVDGGYTQQDVTQAARALTGWTIAPIGTDQYNSAIRKLMEKYGEDKLKEMGYVHEGDFLFAINRHDNKEKTILGKPFPANAGYDEGLRLLDMLAHHTSTAHFICRKLAVRFVSDNPPQSLVDKMAKAFIASNGDIKTILEVMVMSPEFWQPAVIDAKTKSPFELAISTIRILNAQVDQPYQVFNLLDKMGEKIYYYQAPTGFPDRGAYWINTGSLLNRMNFGLAFASQRVPGIKVDLLALNDHHEPESPAAALVTYGKIMLPERDLTQTEKRLTPLLTMPGINKKINEAANNNPVKQPVLVSNKDNMMNPGMKEEKKEPTNTRQPNQVPKANQVNNSLLLSQVVGIIIGSPEFQRK